MSLLLIRDLNVYFPSSRGLVHANRNINLRLESGQKLALVGETGCGKTVLGLTIMRLLPPSARVTGSIFYNGTDLQKLSENEMAKIRGKEIGMLMQNPSASLNPSMRSIHQVSEMFIYHRKLSQAEAEEKALDVLGKMGIGKEEAYRYPHELSGGMRQRIALAIAFSLNPPLLIADEPTKGLDLERKRELVKWLSDLWRNQSFSCLLITHDMEVASTLSDWMAVMYAGEIIEEGKNGDVMRHPRHPYTRRLLEALPSRGMKAVHVEPVSMVERRTGCCYASCCEEADHICHTEHPIMKGTEHRCCCRRYQE